jgi:hypothetical protein
LTDLEALKMTRSVAGLPVELILSISFPTLQKVTGIL